VLAAEHSLQTLANLTGEIDQSVVVIDADQFEVDATLINILASKDTRFLVVGSNWPEERQVHVLVHGAAGYCDEIDNPGLLKKAIESVTKGDVWIQRSLVPKVIGALVKITHPPPEPSTKIDNAEVAKALQTLSSREFEVAKMIKRGDCNKRIAQAMNISERTVKAHLSSIFKKLNVDDRLNLAILLKSQEH